MEPIYIVVESFKNSADAGKFGKVLNWSDKFVGAKQMAEELSRSMPGAEFMVFSLVGVCVQEPVWKSPEQKPVTRDIGIYSPGTK
jgi:hypothetical protein